MGFLILLFSLVTVLELLSFLLEVSIPLLILLCLTQVVEQGLIVGRVHVSANEKINSIEAKELNEDNCTCPNQKPREHSAAGNSFTP